VFFGPVKEPEHGDHGPALDLNVRELAALGPIALLCLLLGVYPQPILETSKRDLTVVANLVAAAKDRQSERNQVAKRTRQPEGRAQVAVQAEPFGVSRTDFCTTGNSLLLLFFPRMSS